MIVEWQLIATAPKDSRVAQATNSLDAPPCPADNIRNPFMEITISDKTLGPVTLLSARRHNNGAVTVRFRSEAGELMAILFDTPTHIVVFDPSYPNLEYRHLSFEAPIRLALKIGGF